MTKLTDFQKRRYGKALLTLLFTLISVVYVFPVLMVLVNSFKFNTFVKTDTFAFPNAETFAGWDNFIKGMTFGGYPFWKSVVYSTVITILSTSLILLFTSMAAWYIARVDSPFCRVIYYLCVFSMVVPFQMVMFTLSKTADVLKLNTPWTIPVIYLGFGAGLAVFMFSGFMKSIPIEIEDLVAGRCSVDAYFSAPPRSAETCNIDFEDVVADLLEVRCMTVSGENCSLVRLEHRVEGRFVAEIVSYDAVLEGIAVRFVIGGLDMQ